MTDCAKKHMVYLIAWFLCMGFVLLSNFSWIALGILVALSIVSLYKNALGAEDKIAKYVTLNIRYYIIISTLFFDCVYIIKHWNGFDFEYIGDNLDSIIENTFSRISEYCQENLAFVVSAGIVSVFFVIIRGKLVKHPFVHTLLEYQFSILLYSILWSAFFENSDLNLAYILFSIVFIMGDLVRKVYDEDETLGNKAGKRCFGLFSFILLLAVILNSQIAVQLKLFDFYAVIELFSRWSTFLFLFIISLVVLISVALIETSLKKGYAYEKIVLLTITSILPVIFVSTKVCVSYRWAVLICYFIYVLISVTRIGPRAFDDKYEYTISDYLPIPLISLSGVFLLLEAQHGKILIAAVLLISTWILVLTFKRISNLDDETKQFTRGISAVIAWLYVNTLSRLWLFHHHYSVFIVISVITIIFLVVIRIINHNPNIYEENVLITLGQFILPVFYLIIALLVFAHGGSDIDVVVEDGYIQVEIEADGKDNTITEAKYCWLDDITEVADDLINESATEYMSLSSNRNIRVRDGLLKIIVEDQNGVRTVKKLWCSNNE